MPPCWLSPGDDEAVAAAFATLLDHPGAIAATRERCLRAAAARWCWEVEGATLTTANLGLDPT